MELITSALISSLAIAFLKVAEKLVDNLTNDIIDPANDQLIKWLRKDYDVAVAREELRSVIMKTLDEVREQLPLGLDRLILTLRITGQTPEIYEQIAASTLEMVKPDPTIIPEKLVKALGINTQDRDLFSMFLYTLRKNLSATPKFEALINYTNEMDKRGILIGIATEITDIAEKNQEISTYLRLLTSNRRLSSDDNQALENYLKDGRKDWGEMILPLIRKRVGTTKFVKMKQVFVPLFLNDKHIENSVVNSEADDYGDRLLKDLAREQSHPLRLSDLISKHRTSILIGNPGSGKTTLLRRAALAFAEGKAYEDLGWQGKPLFPIFVRLRNFGDFLEKNNERYFEPSPGSLIAYLENLYLYGERVKLSPDFFDRRLREGNCLILLDGLDEISQHRADVAQHISLFIQEFDHSGNCFVLSSRPRGFEGDTKLQLSSANLAIAEVSQLRQPEISQLINNLLIILEPDLIIRDVDMKYLPSKILASSELEQIAGNPLFCSALVQVYKYHRTQLPERRVDVLDEIVLLLLGFWHASKPVSMAVRLGMEDGTQNVYYELKQAVEYKLRRLRHLAYYMHSQLRQYEIDEVTAINVVTKYLMDKERVRDIATANQWAINFLINSDERSGLIIENKTSKYHDKPTTYSFIHQAFMEFFAATELVNLEGLVETVLINADDDWWEEVILLAGAHAQTPDFLRSQIVESLLNSTETLTSDDDRFMRRLTLAGHLVRDMGGYLAGSVRDRLEESLYKTMTASSITPVVRSNIADVLHEIYTPIDLSEFITLSVKSYDLQFAKFPVTNSQYQRFLMSPDFQDQELWIDLPTFSEANSFGEIIEINNSGNEGWLWMKSQLPHNSNVLFPLYWNDSRFGISRKYAPVVGISWYEANAYCKWLFRHWDELPEGESNKRPLLVRLPIESEWIFASGGKENFEGFAWDKDQITVAEDEIVCRANIDESMIGRTTVVDMFPQGQSPLGIWDMCGNTWEWQANYSNSNRLYFSQKGGSWFMTYKLAKISGRNDGPPTNRVLSLGFRVVGISK